MENRRSTVKEYFPFRNKLVFSIVSPYRNCKQFMYWCQEEGWVGGHPLFIYVPTIVDDHASAVIVNAVKKLFVLDRGLNFF